MVRAPGEQPRLHVLGADIVACLDLTVGLTDLGQHSFLICHVAFDGVGDQEVGTAAGGLGEPSQAPFDLWFQTNTESGTTCVRHEHMLAHREGTKS